MKRLTRLGPCHHRCCVLLWSADRLVVRRSLLSLDAMERSIDEMHTKSWLLAVWCISGRWKLCGNAWWLWYVGTCGGVPHIHKNVGRTTRVNQGRGVKTRYSSKWSWSRMYVCIHRLLTLTAHWGTIGLLPCANEESHRRCNMPVSLGRLGVHHKWRKLWVYDCQQKE